MTMTQTSYVERLVIVLNADGTLKGAHSESLETIANDGTTIVERMLDAEPITAAQIATLLANVLP